MDEEAADDAIEALLAQTLDVATEDDTVLLTFPLGRAWAPVATTRNVCSMC